MSVGLESEDPFVSPQPVVASVPPAGESGAGRGRTMAYQGQPVRPAAPPRPLAGWPSGGEDEDFVPDDEIDAADLAVLNRELNRARARVFRVSRRLKEAQRHLVQVETDYGRALRRALVGVSGGSAETRKAQAEIQCEPLEDAVVIARQVVEEWKKRALDSRDDLRAIENLSHNARAQIAIA